MNEHLIVKEVPTEERNVTVDYNDAFFINQDNATVTWIYYNPDSAAGGQYVTNILNFDEITEIAKDSQTSNEFLIGLEVSPIRHLPMSELNGFRKQKAVFRKAGFYRLHAGYNAEPYFGSRKIFSHRSSDQYGQYADRGLSRDSSFAVRF